MASLDDTFEFPRELSNNYSVTVEGKNIEYECTVSSLRFEGRDIIGYAHIAKYELIEKAKHALFNPDEIKKINVKKKQQWYVSLYLSDKKRNIFKDGKPAIDYNDPSSYRVAIKAIGLNQGIYMSDELLELVFNPIDEQVKALYLRAFGERPSSENSQVKE